jgi:ribosome-binding ATPase YchF (GTP1/OBG family)
MFWHRRVITLFPNYLQFLSCPSEKHFGNFLANFYPLDWEKTLKYQDLIKLGSEQKVREVGKYMQKGRDYVVEDGDIINFLFNV